MKTQPAAVTVTSAMPAVGRWWRSVPMIRPQQQRLLLLRALSALAAAGAAAESGAGLTLATFDNTALAGEPVETTVVPSLSLHLAKPLPFSAELTGQVEFPGPGRYNIECNFSTSVAIGFVWLDDHEVCVRGAYSNSVTDRSSMDGSPAYPLIISEQMANLKQVVKVQIWTTDATLADPAELDVFWRSCGSGNCTAGQLQPIAGSALSPGLPALEQKRRAFQRPLLSGWATWHPHNYMSFISLPDSAQISLILCQLSTKECLTASVGPDDHSSTLRPGLHAIDRSYAEYSVRF